MRTIAAQPVQITEGVSVLNGDLRMPPHARGLVLFAHGSGSSRVSTRNREVVTREEEAIDVRTRQYRFDIERLGPRVSAAADWARRQPET